MTYANSFDDLRADLAGVLDGFQVLSKTQLQLNDAFADELDKLWQDNAALRDEVHALANRLEALTQSAATKSDLSNLVATYLPDRV